MTGMTPSRTETMSGSQTILIVDDDAILRTLLRGSLQESGYAVIEAGRGEDALRLSKQHPGPIHLLIADVMLPEKGALRLARDSAGQSELNGIEMARRVRAMRPDTRVMFISGHTSDVIKRYGLPPETVFLMKPFAPDALVRKVREILISP